MSYADDIRGALAATSGVSRRVMALRELGLPEQDQQAIQQWLDLATGYLVAVSDTLAGHGITAKAMDVIAGSARNDRAARTQRLMEVAERPWKSVKERVKEQEQRAPRRKRTYEEVFPEDTAVPAGSASEIDAAHPWRTT